MLLLYIYMFLLIILLHFNNWKSIFFFSNFKNYLLFWIYILILILYWKICITSCLRMLIIFFNMFQELEIFVFVGLKKKKNLCFPQISRTISYVFANLFINIYFILNKCIINYFLYNLKVLIKGIVFKFYPGFKNTRLACALPSAPWPST